MYFCSEGIPLGFSINGINLKMYSYENQQGQIGKWRIEGFGGKL